MTNYRGRARGADYTPRRPQFTDEQRIEALERIAGRMERGEANPVDAIEAAAHMRALAGGAEPKASTASCSGPAVLDTTPHCGYCGFLDWTVKTWGRVTHKHDCPARTDPWCQSHPEGCIPLGTTPEGDDYDRATNEVFEAFCRWWPDYDLSGCYDLSDLLNHGEGQLLSEREARSAGVETHTGTGDETCSECGYTASEGHSDICVTGVEAESAEIRADAETIRAALVPVASFSRRREDADAALARLLMRLGARDQATTGDDSGSRPCGGETA